MNELGVVLSYPIHVQQETSLATVPVKKFILQSMLNRMGIVLVGIILLE